MELHPQIKLIWHFVSQNHNVIFVWLGLSTHKLYYIQPFPLSLSLSLSCAFSLYALALSLTLSLALALSLSCTLSLSPFLALSLSLLLALSLALSLSCTLSLSVSVSNFICYVILLNVVLKWAGLPPWRHVISRAGGLTWAPRRGLTVTDTTRNGPFPWGSRNWTPLLKPTQQPAHSISWLSHTFRGKKNKTCVLFALGYEVALYK